MADDRDDDCRHQPRIEVAEIGVGERLLELVIEQLDHGQRHEHDQAGDQQRPPVGAVGARDLRDHAPESELCGGLAVGDRAILDRRGQLGWRPMTVAGNGEQFARVGELELAYETFG